MTKVEWLMACLNEANMNLTIVEMKMIANCSLQVREEYVEALNEKVNLEKEIFKAKKEDLTEKIDDMFKWIEEKVMGV
jgi:hypothetical protein